MFASVKKPLFLPILILLAALVIASGPIYALAQGSGDGTVGPDFIKGEKITHPAPGTKGAQAPDPQQAIETVYGQNSTAGLTPPVSVEKITHPAPGSMIPEKDSNQAIQESYGPNSTVGLTKQESEPITHEPPGNGLSE